MMTDPERAALLFLGKHLAAGVVAGAVFAGGLLVFDVGGLRTLLWQSDSIGVGLYLLFGSACATFGGAAVAVGVMSLGDHADHHDRDY